MNTKELASVLYNMTLGLDYSDGIEFAEDTIESITDSLERLQAEDGNEDLFDALENIGLENVALFDWHKSVM